MAEQQNYTVIEPDDEKDDKTKDNIAAPENPSLIDKTVATEIVNDNKALLVAAQHSLTVVEVMNAAFDRSDETAAAKPLALSIQSSALTIIKARGAMRNSMQLIMEIQRYKPPDVDKVATKEELRKAMEKRKELWKAIQTSSHNIIETTMEVIKTTAKYFSLLTKIYDSIQYFITSQKAKVKKNKSVSLGLSLKYLREDCIGFCKFKDELDARIGDLTQKTLDSMKMVVDSAIGDKNILKWQKQLTESKAKHKKTLQDLLKARNEWTAKTAPLEGALVALKVDRDHLETRINFAKGKVKDLSDAIRRIDSKAEGYRDRAANATKSVPYTYTQNYTIRRTSYSWWGWSSRISYRTESSYSTGWKSVTDTDKQNRLYKAEEHEKRVQKEKEKLQKATEKDIDEWTKALEEDKKHIKKKEEELKTHRKNEKDDINTKQTEVNNALDKVNEAMAEIEKICESAGQQESNVADFLFLLTQLVPASFQSSDGAIRMSESIKTFEEVLQRRIKTKLAIKHYFIESDLDEKYIEALKDNGYYNMEQLICDNDDYKEYLLPIYESVSSNLKVTMATKKILKQFSTKSKIWKPRDEEERLSSKKMLLGQFPALKIFFVVLSKRLDIACQHLQIESSANNKAPLHEQFMIEYSKPKIEEMNDDNKDEKGEEGEEEILLASSIDKSKLTCLDDDFNKIRFKVKSKKMQDKIKKYLKKGKKQSKDTKVTVLVENKGTDDVDYKVLNVELASEAEESKESDESELSDDNQSDEEQEKILIAKSIKESKLICLDNEFNKIKFKVKSKKKRDKIEKYLIKGKKRRKDVKVTVLEKKKGKNDIEYQVKSIDLAESEEDSDESSEESVTEEIILIAKSIKESKLICLDNEYNRVQIKVKSKKMQNKIKKYLKKGKNARKDVEVNISQTKKGKIISKSKVLSVDLVQSSDSDDSSDEDEDESESDTDDHINKNKHKKKKKTVNTKDKKLNKTKKPKNKESNDEEEEESESDNETDDEEESEEYVIQKQKKKGKKATTKGKKSKKAKKSKRNVSSDEGDEESEGDDQTYDKKKKNKKNKTKTKKCKKKVSSDDVSDDVSDEDESESESDIDDNKKKKTVKTKGKKLKKRVSSDEEEEESDSESDNETDDKKKKKYKKRKRKSKGDSDESD